METNYIAPRGWKRGAQMKKLVVSAAVVAGIFLAVAERFAFRG
jgi:hypothetical protein